ncbi:hypothetical protein [Candidatus Nitrososphaera evergladensis]|nr:hypothetical protein [Candidatus Nitrososphaera evergladensis]
MSYFIIKRRLTDVLVQWAAYGSAFSIMSFFSSILVHKDGASDRYIFRGDHHYTSNFKAAIAILITVVVGIAVEEFVLQPYLISVYEVNLGKIVQLLVASGLALFLTIWWHAGLMDKAENILGFIGGCVLAATLFADGFRVIPLW